MLLLFKIFLLRNFWFCKNINVYYKIGKNKRGSYTVATCINEKVAFFSFFFIMPTLLKSSLRYIVATCILLNILFSFFIFKPTQASNFYILILSFVHNRTLLLYTNIHFHFRKQIFSLLFRNGFSKKLCYLYMF